VEADDIQRAIAWCAIDVVISLALLGGLYYWTNAQGPGRARWARAERCHSKSKSRKLWRTSRLMCHLQPGIRRSASLDHRARGKSMLLRCIAGLEHPDRGRIVLNDRVLFDSEKSLQLPARERRVGMLFSTMGFSRTTRLVRTSRSDCAICPTMSGAAR